MRDSLKEKLLRRIEKTKAALEAEGAKNGWIRDRRGLRYIPTETYLKMEEYSEAMNYMKWFLKNFPRDKGFPEFLLEWSIIHFKNGNMKEAKYKVFETYCSNIYIFEKYFGKEYTPVEMFHKNENESAEYTKFIHFSSGTKKLEDFDQWLEKLLADEKFQTQCEKFIEIRKALLDEQDSANRSQLNRQEQNLKYDL